MFGRKKAPGPGLDIESLSFPELKDLKERVEALMSQQFEAARETFRVDIVDKMGSFGFTLDDFKPPKRKKRIVAIKYRNPDNPDETWSGLGKPKKWLQEKLDAGQQLEEFAIQ